MTQSYYEPIQYDLDGKEDLLYWRKLLLSLSDMSSIKSYSNIPHNLKVVQHLLFNKDFAHSVIYTLTLIESYLNIVLKDNESDAVTMRNQFGRLKVP
jgi:uncharacterized alpha-E superfamily protein